MIRSIFIQTAYFLVFSFLITCNTSNTNKETGSDTKDSLTSLHEEQISYAVRDEPMLVMLLTMKMKKQKSLLCSLYMNGVGFGYSSRFCFVNGYEGIFCRIS